MAPDINGQVLRVIDANANRAREALRTIEDYARFILDSAELAGAIKNIRHQLAAVLKLWLAEAVVHRDTPGDVGVALKTEAERSREDLGAVVTAAGKRAGEALRTIEEFLKVLSPGDAARIETLRYSFYELEKRVLLTLRPVLGLEAIRLYVLITESICKRPWLEAAALAIEGGADCLQLREKNLESAELLARARELVGLCRTRRVLCIINDRADIALLSNADGVHLGQTDLPVSEARKIVGNRRIIGVSTHNLQQARAAQLDGADYIGVGPIFKSATKPRDFVAGLEYAWAVAKSVSIPTMGIAGIGPENVDELLKTGVRAIAVTASVVGCDDVREAARVLKAKLTAPHQVFR
ncbi:MAG: thiamine phosphate synthase [Planctomycetota bacterium]|nr:thiamine phosphate synthase [Planctomycetota bacterium]